MFRQKWTEAEIRQIAREEAYKLLKDYDKRLGAAFRGDQKKK